LPIAPRLAGPLQAPTDLSNTHPLLAHPGKHLVDDLRFVGDEVETGDPSPERLAYIMIAIGGTTQDADDSRVRAMPFAAAAAF